MNPDEMIKEVNTRFAELTKMEQDCVAAIQGKQADLNAILGAKQDCQFWLQKIATMGQAVAPAASAPAFVPDTTGQDMTDAKPANPLDAAKDSDETIQ